MTTVSTSKRPLSAEHHTVAHTSKHRTRLRVPKNKRSHVKFSKAKQAIEAIPGVRSVEVNDDTGSVLIHHDETPGLFEDVSEALAESAPDLLAALLLPEAEGAEIGLSFLASIAKHLFMEPHPGNTHGEGTAVATSTQSEFHFEAGNVNYRKVVPMAFIGIGLWQMLEQEALLAGIAPIALLYYGFDMYWKFNQVPPIPDNHQQQQTSKQQ